MQKSKIALLKSIFIICSCSLLSAAPPLRTIPEGLLNEYTINGQIPFGYTYYDGTHSLDEPTLYKKEEIDKLIDQALQKQPWYYGQTDVALFSMLDKYRSYIQGKIVGIIGSVKPWYESIILAYGGHPVTIEYNKIISDDSRLTLLTVEEYETFPQRFDAILSISSIEHDGLGRYGDPIDPWGDIQSMQKMKGMIKEDGLLFIAFPVGEDYLLWNAHRIYGGIRLPLLFQGWRQEDFAKADFQPVFVLSPDYSVEVNIQRLREDVMQSK